MRITQRITSPEYSSCYVTHNQGESWPGEECSRENVQTTFTRPVHMILLRTFMHGEECINAELRLIEYVQVGYCVYRNGRESGHVVRTAWQCLLCCLLFRQRSSSALSWWLFVNCGRTSTSAPITHAQPAAWYAVVELPTFWPVDAALLASSALSPSPSPSAGRPITFLGQSLSTHRWSHVWKFLMNVKAYRWHSLYCMLNFQFPVL